MDTENYGLMEPTDSESVDTVSDGYATGDVNDDDGQAIDSFFEAPDTRHDTRTDQSVAVPVESLPVPQKIISSTGYVAPGKTVQLLNADLNREGYELQAHCTDNNRAGYQVASDNDAFVAVDATGVKTFGRWAISGLDTGVVLPDYVPYNGPLYIHANAANDASIFYIVTSYTR